jgi:hypothetical protein
MATDIQRKTISSHQRAGHFVALPAKSVPNMRNSAYLSSLEKAGRFVWFALDSTRTRYFAGANDVANHLA